jgi:threonylcarbamoyladenosine tRNA methylthiotransferase MtaB
MQLISDLPFTSLHVFPFSPRPGTAAIRLKDRVAHQVVTARAAELRDLGTAKSRAYATSRIGGLADVVVVEHGRGLTGDYLSLDVPDQCRRRDRFGAIVTQDRGRFAAIPL